MDSLIAYESDELFSDEEQKNEIKYKSDGSQDTLNKSETSLFSFDDLQRATSTNATIPSTPLSLLPLLSKINEQWSSDLETPQGKQYFHTHTKPSTSITTNTGDTPRVSKQYTPDGSAVKCTGNKITSESPVIVTEDVIRRPKRCIFKSSTSTDSSALDSTENIISNMQIEVRESSSEDSKLIVQSNPSNIVSISSVDDIFEDHVSTVSKEFQDTHDSDKSVNIISDNLNALSEEIFKNISCNNIDNIYSNNLDKLTMIKNTTECHDKQSNKRGNMPDICDMNEMQENKNIGFFTASGTPIHISKEALAKVETLFANDFEKDEKQIQNYHLFTNQNIVEENEQATYSTATSIDITKEKFLEEKISTEHAYEKALIKDCTNLGINKNFMERMNISPPRLSITSNVPVDIAKEALSTPNILIKESDNNDNNDVFRKNETFANKNFMQQENKVQTSVSITDGIPISMSKEPLIEENMFAQQFRTPVKSVTSNKIYISGPDDTDMKDSLVKFEITSDISNNTSNQAKLKSEAFAEQLDDPMKSLISGEDDIINKKKEHDVNLQNIGFQTARGAPINISNRALSKAKILFAEQSNETLLNSVIPNKTDSNNEETKKEAKMSIMGFQTARGAPISISEQALSKAKMSFAEQSDEIQSVIPNKTNSNDEEVKKEEAQMSTVSFQTARGVSISISEQSLSKAKMSFAEQSDEILLESVITKKSNNNNGEVKREEARMSTIGFQTARGAPISISEQALSKAQTSFAEQSDETLLQSVIPNKKRNINEEVKREEAEMSTIGFQTARGAPISISERALSKAKISFAEQSDETLLQSVIPNKKNYIKEKAKIPNIGFQTARGTSIHVSEQALSKAKVLFSEQLDNPLSHSVITEKINDNNKEIKISNVGFQTALGAPISISEQALSKAKMSFAEQLDETLLQQVIPNKKNNSNEEEIKEKTNISNIGFQTARGTSIDISDQALSKAKVLFAEQLNNPLSHSVIMEEINDNNKEIKISNVGFQTARGAPISISEQALSKAKMSFAEQSDETLLQPVIPNKKNNSNEEVIKEKANISNIGFQTARGTSIHISEQALSKAKVLFAEQSDNLLSHSAIMEEINDNEKEIKISNNGFQTARGAPISISEQALSKAKMSFAEQSDEILKSVITKKTNNNNEEVKREEAKMSTIGFQTARGAPISISERALSKAKISFAEQSDTCLETVILENNEKLKECNLENSYNGFQTASGQHVTVSNNALLKARQLFSDTSDKSSCGMSHSSFILQKRKLTSDEGTPPSRNYIPGSKKVRLNNEFQARKLFSSNSDTKTDDGKIPVVLSKSKDICNTSEIVLISHNDKCNKENYTTKLSSEIVTDIATDIEKNQTNSMDYTLDSPQKDTVESNVLHRETELTGSPVIGRQANSRKRKSFGHRKDKHSALCIDKKIISQDTFREKFLSIDTCSKEINETENIVVQKSMQVESQNIGHTTDSSEYSDTQIMMDFIDESAKILQNRLAAALDQEKLITMKKKHKSKQKTGSLYRYKQIHSNNRLSLRKISNGVPPVPYSYQELIDQRISPNILTITATTAISYKFRCSDFYGNDTARSNIHGIEMEDGARLILDENGYVGVREFHRAFLATSSIDPNLVPEGWIENHYRWIVWKLASMDRMKFNSVKLPRTLTPSCVMAQLKYRYDREIDRSQRPAIRRILEKDDVASKRIILCVSSITENDNAKEIRKNSRMEMFKWKIELTDGWYSIQACVDVDMIKNISIGKVREGTKFVTYGAELLNCDQGCYPLEAPSDVYLKLHTNSTRRTRWDMKLGYASNPGPIPIKLHNVCPNGGLIGKMTVIVARVYPMLYHERTTSGESIMRNTKCEEKACIEYEKQCRFKVETFYDKAEKDFKRQESSSETDSMNLLATQLSNDCERSSTQKFRLKEERFQQKLESELRENMPAPRQVSPLLKVRVCDQNTHAILSIWSPSEEVIDIFKEGACVSLYNVVASGKRGCELQLTARRMAIFKRGTMHDVSYPLRTYTSFSEIRNTEFAPSYGEFDTVGFVCSVGPAPFGMKNFEVVHLAYVIDSKTDLNDFLYLSILFWQGIANYGYTEILTVGSIVACSNLEWRRATSWNVPMAYCTEKSIFTRNPRRNHLYEPFQILKGLITDPVIYAEKCNCELNIELQKKPMMRTPMRYTLNKNTPNKMIYNSISSSGNRLIDYTSPVLNSSFGDTNISNFTANNSSIQRRLDKLKYYGEPPELSPIILKNSSSRISLDFRSPINASTINVMRSASDINRSESSNSNEPEN